ncbi:MAG: alpha/beta fold hydrolase [bacterium]
MGIQNEHEFVFPVGYHRFHKDQLFNFQLNRWYSLGYAKYEDCVEAGNNLKTFGDWKRELLRLAERALAYQELISAAFYFRAAEFFLLEDIPEKQALYEKFNICFYEALQQEQIERFTVPYRGSFLPAMKVLSTGTSKGTVLLHGGFDSFIEEFYSMMKYFSKRGYEVIAFDGPGQGAARRKYDLPFDYEWEKPIKAVLDYFDLNNVTLYAISMGGWLGLRAAAFEPRIARVIASGHAIDYMQSMNAIFRKIHVWFFKHYKDFMNRMAIMKMKREGMFPWMVKHLMYITKKTQPMDALEIYLLMNEQNIHSELVKQDILILTGREDHLIPFKMHKKQIDALVNAKSVTGRVFTREEHAQNHCQTGNIGLALDVIVNWIDEKLRCQGGNCCVGSTKSIERQSLPHS